MSTGEVDPSTPAASGKAPRRIKPPSAARLRVLVSADRLFYADGIRTMGVDNIIAQSSITKATFYKHYGSKDRLILEYVQGRDRASRAAMNDLIETAASSREALVALAASIAAEIQSPDFHGCAFMNAAGEFRQPGHQVRLTVADHRDWLSGVFTGLLGDMGHSLPGDAADDLILARDGAMAGGFVGDPVASSAAFQRAAERIIAEARS